MATENPGQIVTREAGTNVTNKRFVKDAAGGIVNRCDTQGEAASGVVAMISTGFTGTTIASGNAAPIALAPTPAVIIEAGGAVAANAEFMTDNVGRAITFAAGGGAVALGRNVGAATTAAGQDLSGRLYAPPQHV